MRSGLLQALIQAPESGGRYQGILRQRPRHFMHFMLCMRKLEQEKMLPVEIGCLFSGFNTV
jgi:hypothetical protein